jgi:hypothetical protein
MRSSLRQVASSIGSCGSSARPGPEQAAMGPEAVHPHALGLDSKPQMPVVKAGPFERPGKRRAQARGQLGGLPGKEPVILRSFTSFTSMQ